MPLQIRRGTEAERQTLATPLVSGELLWITDDFRLYIGDGATLAKDLTPVTGYGDDNAKDAAASIFTAGTHSGISFSYDGSTAIDATVSYPALLENLSLNGFNITGSGNISIAGNVTVDGNLTGNFKGSIFADDSTLIIDGLTGTVNLAGTIRGNVLPDNNEVYDLGSPSLRFKDLYLSGSSLYLGDAQITATGSAVNLPLGSTINGVPIPNVESGVVSGSNYFINIVGDDSTLLIDSQNKVVTADEINAQLFTGFVLGDVKGSVFADDSGALVNAVSNEIGNVNTTYNGISMDAGFNSFRLTSDLADIFQTYPFYDTGRVPAIVIRSSKGSDRGPSEPGDFIANFRTDGLTPLDYEGNGPNTLYRYCTGIISGWTAAADFNFNHPESALYLTTGPNDNDDLHIATFSKGNFTAPAITPGVYADSTARDAYLTSPTAGMMVFLTDTQQFQGYVSDTGLAGGGASNSTPGWINLN